MKKMLWILLAVWGLSACVATAPKLTEEEKRKKAWSTMNFYDDNRVALRLLKASAQAGDQLFWSENPAEAIMVSTGDQHYNLLDVAKIVKDFQTGKIILKDGTTTDFKTREIRAFVCEKGKECLRYSERFKSAYDLDLSAPQRTLQEFGIIRNENAIDHLRSARGELVTMNKGEYEALMSRLASAYEVWGSKRREAAEQERKKTQAAIEREQYIIKEAAEMRRNVRVGTKTNCGNVFELRMPMVGVQTMYGAQFLRLTDLYGPSAACRFHNGQYVGR